ncbi:histone acetyltransferase [Striga asiatica]|uniref:Histone acetyltransferase n=1 Tax=Striga asiatica TaxID=4170 RepID=A0A5A7P6L0_STRAF|nr:histone acetyltransferase [Striga asiatica]
MDHCKMSFQEVPEPLASGISTNEVNYREYENVEELKLSRCKMTRIPTTSKGTKYTQETKLETIPATPLAKPIRVASGIFRPSVYLRVISFDISSEVKARTRPGNDPIADVPKPLKIPGKPSFRIMYLKTDNPLWEIPDPATCILVFTTAVGCINADWTVKRIAPMT